MRKPKDRDFIRTREGMFFCVTGYLHPPGRYTAYLKYSPTAAGKWADDQTAYRRELDYYHVRNVAKTIRHLERRYPHYVHRCPARGFRFSMVPEAYVAQYYTPETRLRAILETPVDALEEEVRALATEIAACAHVPPTALGVTGSILIGLHNPDFSDIDLTVYGLGNARKVRQALLAGRSARIRRLDETFIARWSAGIADRFPLSEAEARHFARRRWNYGTFEGRYFSLHPIRSDAEITERYGDHRYRGQGAAHIRATVVDAGEALFMPAVYRVADVRRLHGDQEALGVREIVSYEGLYRDIVDAGAEIEARGKLESVDGAVRRLVIGAMELGGQGYVKPAATR